ncbi:hypothetical protein SCUCBS95973_009345 [Sporothrix curviconia]|uniref:Heterokaryon incompatibility domain-containing protein n=1 Tax=Sporothrix curviconia TaxID=1260050 RepID=A0ABP0CV65_9PEZI
MRLLDTASLKVVPFLESSRNATQLGAEANDHSTLAVPRYAILSHTWEAGEVTLQEMARAADDATVRSKPGYKKIEQSCELARQEGLEYIWIDTCCIDKTNSTELFEAINSMFTWYRNAWVCYVHLADALVVAGGGRDSVVYRNPRRLYVDLYRWYSRGWTLQELVASRNVAFYSADWQPMGTKTAHLMEIARGTGIDPATLAAAGGADFEDHLARISVARRMHWLAYRETTRPEDLAYCMLGIFGIHMPVLYGEGDRAFVRLQEELLKSVDDQSLFAWKEDDSLDYYRDDYGNSFRCWGLLARVPAEFRVAKSVARFRDTRSQRPAIQLSTSRGIQTTFLMCRDRSYSSGDLFLAVLDCHVGRVPGVYAGIRLKRTSSSRDEFVRVDTQQLLQFCAVDAQGRQSLAGFDHAQPQPGLYEMRYRTLHADWTPRTIFVRQDYPLPPPPGLWLVPPPGNRRPRGGGAQGSVRVLDIHPRHQWDADTWTVQPTHIDYWAGVAAAWLLQLGDDGPQLVIAAGGFPDRSSLQMRLLPWCRVLPLDLFPDLAGYAAGARGLAKTAKEDAGATASKGPDIDLGIHASIESIQLYGQEMLVVKMGYE